MFSAKIAIAFLSAKGLLLEKKSSSPAVTVLQLLAAENQSRTHTHVLFSLIRNHFFLQNLAKHIQSQH